MATRRPYKASVRLMGAHTGKVYPGRFTTFSTRERAIEAITARLAETIADEKRVAAATGAPFNPTSWDATVFGPDADLVTGLIIRHDGTQADLIETIREGSRKARESLYAAGWTDEDIERGRRA
jgi:uncharacterized protein YciW